MVAVVEGWNGVDGVPACQPAGGRTDFAGLLNTLLAEWGRANGTTVRNSDVVHRLADNGYRVSRAYISQLRNGRRDRPSDDLIEQFERCFGVSADYFARPSVTPVEGGDAALLAELSDPVFQRLMLLADGLAESTLSLLIDMAERLRQAEGLGASAGL
ncbi:hypothetical protein ACWIGW_16735 [Nocardia brasiliensis]